MFGVQRELVELVRIQFLTARQARIFYQKGYPNLAKLATADRSHIQDILKNSVPFHRYSTFHFDCSVAFMLGYVVSFS